VTADNPQAYANNIILFDRPRGSGESIWDIKRKIGFLSPEMHLYFDQQATGFEVVASGLFDTIGLFRQLNDYQAGSVHSWLRILGLVSFSGKRMSQLSASQQRMLLLARALVKNPPLLVLDEPAQGLDAAQHGLLKAMLNEICTHFGTTLIYVSHYPADLPACITNYLVLNGGKAVV
jgi:molybdate transport system ATP-binding protein